MSTQGAREVMSSRLCKSAEGAGFPFQVEFLEDGVDDPIHGLHVDEADHGPGSSPDFDEASLDDVGGAQLAPQVLGESVKCQQFGQVALQLFGHGGIFAAPATAEGERSLESSRLEVKGTPLYVDLPEVFSQLTSA